MIVNDDIMQQKVERQQETYRSCDWLKMFVGEQKRRIRQSSINQSINQPIRGLNTVYDEWIPAPHSQTILVPPSYSYTNLPLEAAPEVTFHMVPRERTTTSVRSPHPAHYKQEPFASKLGDHRPTIDVDHSRVYVVHT